MSNIVTHLGQNLNWTAYKNGHNQFIITVTQSGSAFNLSAYVFTLNIKTPGGDTTKLALTEGSGITNGGVTGILTIDLTQVQASTTLPRNDYFYELIYTKSSKVYPFLQGGLTLSNERNPGSTNTSATVSVNLAGSAISASVSLSGRASGEVALIDFDGELTFDEDKDLTTVSGTEVTFSLAASGHLNGIGIIARVNEPTDVIFPAAFERVAGSDDIVTTKMNIIIFRYYEDYDGAGNDKVLYVVKNQTAV